MLASFILGSLMGLCQLTLAASNPLFLNCFEVAVAIVVSFLAKALSSTGYFCWQSCVSAGIVMILPGYVILAGASELAVSLSDSFSVGRASLAKAFLPFACSVKVHRSRVNSPRVR